MKAVATSTMALLTGCLAVGQLAGCATIQQYPAPTPDRFAHARSNVERAGEKVAPEDAEASQHLQQARTELAEAESAMRTGQTDRASLLLVRAETDAELASKLAAKEKVAREAARAEQEAGSAAPASAAPGSSAPAGPLPASSPPPPAAASPVPTPSTGAAQ